MINCNPETVSTDYDTSNRLYFEPLTLEDVLGVIELEQPEGVIVQFGGQTPLRLAAGPRARRRASSSAPSVDAIDAAEDRGRFGALLDRARLQGGAVRTAQGRRGGTARSERVGFPLLVRPSYVLGGRAMEIVYSRGSRRLPRALGVGADGREIYLDRFLENAIEVDVDALCDGTDVWVAGIMQHVEEAGIHSGDSACVLPPHSLGEEMLERICEPDAQIALALGVVGLINIQFAVVADRRAVRDRGQPARLADRPVRLQGDRLPARQARLPDHARRDDRRARPARRPDATGTSASRRRSCPFDRFLGADSLLGPEMRSTGEVMGIASDFPTAFAKAQAAAGSRCRAAAPRSSPSPTPDKPAGAGLAAQLHDLDFRIVATRGTGAGDRADGDPRHDAQQGRRGLAPRRRLDRPRRCRPRDQHADRLGRPLRRLGDPPRRTHPRDPRDHDDVRAARRRFARSAQQGAASRPSFRCRSCTAADDASLRSSHLRCGTEACARCLRRARDRG
jgi:carbamoyl-phosphate synthase large subunit